ncbi:aryl-sulfate sulfotransferase [Fulvivirgaceae bacterium BMA12]|uniref:Aryl-sulfate sulfotransferase n=1 Tax=Agaribacillus aureus TaxID=3051825 RepID=A0ABT8LBN6_9BACT|nr:aryl-sulfate sulfotransferase [Fulvivirgaceae bacterium BMA12]
MIRIFQFYLLSGFMFFVACGPATCPESIFVNMEAMEKGRNNLRFEIGVETTAAGSVQIKYWKSKEEGEVFISDISTDDTKHLITLSPLSPGEKYTFTTILKTADCQIESDPREFAVGTVPSNLTPMSWVAFDSTAFSGYLLLQRRTPRGNVHLIDRHGEIVWYQTIEGMVKVSHWTKENTILVLYGNDQHKNSAGADIVGYDLSGKKTLHLNLEEKGYIAHHEVTLDADGNVMALVYDNRILDLTSKGGEANQSVIGDGILILDRNGKELWKWSVFDHHDPLADPDLLGHLDDWGHANALSVDMDGNFLLSFRDWNQVWKVDAKTGEVLWKFGEGGDFELDSTLHFSGQHAIHRNARGHYMLFDNGREQRKSRILSFTLDTAAFTAAPEIVIDLPDEFYADRMGSAYLIDNGNILVCTPRSRSILVLNPEGEILCNAYVGVPDPYRAEYVKLQP